MSNLIITIISIALVAVTLLVGAMWLNTAYTAANEKAIATTLQNNLEQVNAAYKIYKAENANSDINAINDLTPKYLASVPSIPAIPDANSDPNSGFGWQLNGYPATGGITITYYDNLENYTGGQSLNKICLQYNKLYEYKPGSEGEALPGIPDQGYGSFDYETACNTYHSVCWYDTSNSTVNFTYCIEK